MGEDCRFFFFSPGKKRVAHIVSLDNIGPAAHNTLVVRSPLLTLLLEGSAKVPLRL